MGRNTERRKGSKMQLYEMTVFLQFSKELGATVHLQRLEKSIARKNKTRIDSSSSSIQEDGGEGRLRIRGWW